MTCCPVATAQPTIFFRSANSPVPKSSSPQGKDRNGGARTAPAPSLEIRNVGCEDPRPRWRRGTCEDPVLPLLPAQRSERFPIDDQVFIEERTVDAQREVSSMETPRRPEERASSTPRVREYRPRWRVSHRDGRRRRPCKRRDFHRRRAARPPCTGPGRKCPERMPKSTKAHPKACRSTGRKRPRKRPCNFREARPGVPSTPDGRTSLSRTTS